MAPAALSAAAAAAGPGDADWDALEADVVITTTSQPVGGIGPARARVKRMHVRRAHDADGRWFTRYSYPDAPARQTAMERAHGVDPAELYVSDDRTDVHMVMRDGRVVRSGALPDLGPEGVGLRAKLGAAVPARYDEIRHAISSTVAPRRAPHWLDASVVGGQRRERIEGRLRAIAGPPSVDSRGRPVFTSVAGGGRTRVALDSRTGDIEDVEAVDATQRSLRMQVEHAQLPGGRVVRSRVHYELSRGGGAPPVVSDLAFSNFRVTGGGQ